jgi:hypothetical protein
MKFALACCEMGVLSVHVSRILSAMVCPSSHALVEHEQVQVEIAVLGCENICEFILDDYRILTVFIHS